MTAASSPSSTTARPPAMRGYPYLWLVVFLGVMVALRFIPQWGNDQTFLFNLWLVYTVMVVGFYFVFGLSGQFAFSQAAFAMVGGYTSAWATRQGMNFIVAVAFGVAVAAVIAIAFAWVARRANLFFLAIATLALSEIINQVITQWNQFTGVDGAELHDVAPIDLFGWTATAKGQGVGTSQRNLFWVYLAAVAVTMLIGLWLARAPVKREAIALRDQPTVGSSLGVPTLRLRLTMFVLGSAIGAFAGALSVHGNGYAQPTDYTVELGLGIFVMLIVGGIDSLWGPVLGAGFYVWLPHFLQRLDLDVFGHQIREYNQIIYGAALLLTMIFMPEGLVGVGRRIRARVQRRTSPARRTWLTDLFGITKPPELRPTGRPIGPLPTPGASARAAAASGVGTHREPAILRAEDIAVNFGGVVAVDGVSLAMTEGQILGLVGPNGSGKTTFVNALTGVVPSSGTLEVAGVPVPLGAPGRARRAGLLRTYQAPQTYDHLTCVEDVLLSTADRQRTGIMSSWFLRRSVLRHERERWRRASEAIVRVGLGRYAETPAGRLTYGQRRLLELARAIAAQPKVLMLDEPSAGLDDAETEQLARYLEDLRDEGVSLFVIDHKLDFITGLCDRVAVFELGHLVAVGDAATVFQDQRVVDAYLGVAEVD
ncbi:MAG TPA: branched-chain amino acid ABC transporter ATP-binding protein/permease [Acidimicrobiia bacterium]|nr:branched-chain amino acid ABC transporter ATP-binding protein/permease [Acidimicrobiia bacterium]